GTWDLSVSASDSFIFPQRTVEVMDGVDENDLLLVGYVPTARISGGVADSLGEKLDFAFVSAEAEINDVKYSQWTFTDLAGNFSIEAFNTNWLISAQASSYKQIPAQNVAVSGSDLKLHFVAEFPTNHLTGRVVDD